MDGSDWQTVQFYQIQKKRILIYFTWKDDHLKAPPKNMFML